jgi:hypothetical protein
MQRRYDLPTTSWLASKIVLHSSPSPLGVAVGSVNVAFDDIWISVLSQDGARKTSVADVQFKHVTKRVSLLDSLTDGDAAITAETKTSKPDGPKPRRSADPSTSRHNLYLWPKSRAVASTSVFQVVQSSSALWTSWDVGVNRVPVLSHVVAKYRYDSSEQPLEHFSISVWLMP